MRTERNQADHGHAGRLLADTAACTGGSAGLGRGVDRSPYEDHIRRSAAGVLRQLAEAGIEESKYRPRPGQIVPMVQELRRKRALEQAIAGVAIGQSDPEW